MPQWSPAMKTGNTDDEGLGVLDEAVASMEPGHEDREYGPVEGGQVLVCGGPQWSPAMKTGNTQVISIHLSLTSVPQWSPAMKTGNTCGGATPRRENLQPQWSPAMKTGNTATEGRRASSPTSLNGARP